MDNFLHKIRKADYRTKQKWLVAGTALAMLLVVALWIVYMSAVVPGLARNAERTESFESSASKPAPGPAENVEEMEGAGFVETFVRGVRVIGGYISRIAGGITEKVDFGKTYHFEKENGEGGQE